MKSALGLPAPAKLNVFLHVTGRLPDGRHALESVFTLIDWSDEIDLWDLSGTAPGRVERTGDLLCDAEKDLAVRAARLLMAERKPRGGVRIRVKKRIPAGAGMGGGSSDAATVLMGLNRLWNLGLTRGELMKLGERLGADVPFFIFGRTAFAEGFGEKLRQFDLPASRYLVAWPAAHVPTGEIFAAPNLTRDTPSHTIAFFSDLVRKIWPALPGRNDLEPVAEAFSEAVRHAKTMFASAGLDPRMTGSGSAVFAVLPERSDVDALAASFPEDWAVRGVSGMAKHPLSDWLTD